MFIPFIIALIMGLIPSSYHHTNCHGGGTVYVISSAPGDPEEGDPDDDGEDGPGGPTGDNGQLPPPKP